MNRVYSDSDADSNIMRRMSSAAWKTMRRSPAERKSFRSPFWLAASNFYILAAAFTIAVFFLSWGVLNDVNEEGSFIPAGVISSVVLLSTVVFRAIVLRKVRRRIVATRRLDQNLAV